MPAIASNITTPLLGLADVAIVGHIGNAMYIAAIALGGAVINMLYWVFSFLRLGSSGLTAQAFGANDTNGQSAIFYRGLAVAAILATAILALQPLITVAVLSFMDAGGNTSVTAQRYVSICIWGAPAVLGSYALSGWMLGMQYSRGPMWMALVTNIVNIATSIIFVFALGYDIAGVAAGTCIAQWTGFVCGLILVRKHFSITQPNRHRILNRNEIKRFFSVNTDIFLRTLCLVAVTLWFTRAGTAQGTLTLAANALLMQFFLLFSYFTDGFAFAGEALAGKYYGARNPVALKRCIRSLLKTGAALATVFACLYFVAGDNLMNLLTSDTQVVDTASEYLVWTILVPFAGFVAFTWDGIFGGLTLTRTGMLVPMMISAALFFALCTILIPQWGNHGLWCSFIIYCTSRGVIQTIYYIIHRRQLNKSYHNPKTIIK